MFRVALHLVAGTAIALAVASPAWAQEAGTAVRGPTPSSAPSAELDAPGSTEARVVQEAPGLTWTDAGYATAATATLLWGLTSTRTRILCAGPVTDQHCPQELQVSRTRTRQHLVGGLMATGLIGLAGYLHHRYDERTSFSVDRSNETATRGQSVSVGLLAGGIDERGVSLDLLRLSF